MKYKPQPWQLIVLIAVVCSLAVGGMFLRRSRLLTPAALLKRLPEKDSLVLGVDFAALRRNGFLHLLASSSAPQEREYRAFVSATRFDYMNDLDTVFAAFPESGGTYIVANGHFDWRSLRAYVSSQHGTCINSLCRLTGSKPERLISFLPLRSDVMAMAVSTNAYAVNNIALPPSGPYNAMPEGMVWLRFPGSLPKGSTEKLDGSRAFARIVENAPMVTISFVADGDQLAAKLDAECRTGQEAEDMSSQFRAVTSTARTMFEREHTAPSPADFGSILTSGEFHREGNHLIGRWPIHREFVQALLGS